MINLPAEMLNLIESFLKETKPIKRTILKNGLTISSVCTPDIGFETAILDFSSAIPVERYQTLKECENGHEKWVEFALTNPEQVTKLGYLFLDPEIVMLEYPEKGVEDDSFERNDIVLPKYYH